MPSNKDDILIQSPSNGKYFFLLFFSYLIFFTLATVIFKPGILQGDHVFLTDAYDDDLAFTSAKKYIASLWYKGEFPLFDSNTLCGIPVLGNHVYTPLSPLVFLVAFPGIPQGAGHTFTVILLYSFGAGFICLYVTRILQCNLSLGFALGIIYIVSESTELFAKCLGQFGGAVFIPAILYFMDSQDQVPPWRNNVIVAVLLALSFYFGSVDFFLINCFLVAGSFLYRAVKNRAFSLYLFRLTVILSLVVALGATIIFPTIEIILQSFPRSISVLKEHGGSSPFIWLMDSLTPRVLWNFNEWYLYDYFHNLMGLTVKPYFNGFVVLGPLSLFCLIYAFVSGDEKTKFSRDFYLAVMGFFIIFIWLLYDTGLPEKYMIAKRFPYLRDSRLMLLPLYIFMCARLFQDIIADRIDEKNTAVLKKTTIILGSLSAFLFVFTSLAIFVKSPTLYKISALWRILSGARINYLYVVFGFGSIFCCFFLFYKLLTDKKASLLKKEFRTVFLFCLCLLPARYYTHITGFLSGLIKTAGQTGNYGDTSRQNTYDEDVKITPAESFIKKRLDPRKERAAYPKGYDNFLRQLLFDIPIVGGYGAFYHKRFHEFCRRVDGFGVGGLRDLMVMVPHPELPVVDLLALKYIITEEETVLPRKWKKVFEDNSSDKYRYVYRNDKALNRFFTVSSAKIFDDKDSLLASMNMDLQNTALILDKDLDTNAREFLRKLTSLPSPNKSGDNIEIDSYKSASITLTTETSTPGILIISNAWYPGWSCKIDGNASKIYPFYYAFQGILLPSGKHHIELDYSPKSFKISVIISLISFAGVIVFFLLYWKRVRYFALSSREKRY